MIGLYILFRDVYYHGMDYILCFDAAPLPADHEKINQRTDIKQEPLFTAG
jgi:hypothetical protein